MHQSQLAEVFAAHAALDQQASHNQRRFYAVLGNSQRLDGGAMFGNAPKALWQRWITADEQNRILLACRCLLIEEANGRRILCETGIGAFFEPKMKHRFGVQEDEHILLKSLASLGVEASDIDVVVLSHLHFDHAGGLLKAWQEDQESSLCFPNAHYIVGEQAWERALKPHSRDRASFIPVLPNLLQETGKLEIVATGDQSEVLGHEYHFYYSHGHTPGQMHLIMPYAQHSLIFAGDLIPGTSWVNPAITMGYDRYPEMLIDEKKILLSQVHTDQAWLFFTHDPQYAVSQVQKNHKGKYQACEMLETIN
jgi:glyoxylase-like metal-dependent hydrolase (beta-lactamase superfamily II)